MRPWPRYRAPWGTSTSRGYKIAEVGGLSPEEFSQLSKELEAAGDGIVAIVRRLPTGSGLCGREYSTVNNPCSSLA